jgi:ferritin-like metal-binding protein YciE
VLRTVPRRSPSPNFVQNRDETASHVGLELSLQQQVPTLSNTRRSTMEQQSPAHDLYITGLKNAHAMESQALSIMRPQADRIRSYPEVEERLRQHINETEEQVERLEALLDDADADKSLLKDIALSAAGGMAALGHAAAGDEILKNAFADFAFENYEIAAYRALITIAEQAGEEAAVSVLRQNLAEEEAMASWLEENLADVTQQFLSLSLAGEKAKH